MIQVGSYGAWSMLSGGAPGDFNGANWITDFSSVTAIGLYVLGNVSAGALYGLDNFATEYYVPEPETLWMIMAVVLSLCVTFRGRIAELLAQLKAKALRA
jgi:hypothetical protein